MSATRELLLASSSLQDDAPMSRKTTRALLVNALLGAIPAAQYGWAIGVMNFPTAVMCADLGGLDSKGLIWSAGVNASFCVAGFLGSHFAGGLSDSLGRRKLIQYLNAPFLLAAALGITAGIVKGTSGFGLLIVARILSGAASGAGSVVTPMYLGEIATPQTKGAFGALFQFGIVILILIVQIAGVRMSTPSLWGPMLGISGVLSILSLLTAPLLLESPKWLLSHDAEVELEELEAEAQESGSGGAMGLRAIINDPTLRAPLLVTVVLLVTQQFSGINAVFFYSTSFFTDAGVDPTAGTLAAGAVNMVATAIAIPLIERLGRRPLVLAGIGGMLISALALTGVLVAKASSGGSSTTLGYVAILCVMTFVAFFEIGLGAIPWSIGGELFPSESRGAAMALGAAGNWVANTAVVLLFPLINAALGNYSFAPFAIWLTLALIFAVARVPETKGKTPAELIRKMSPGYAQLSSSGDNDDRVDSYRVKELR